MALGNILWWFAFTVLSIWGQVFFQGVDFLVAGFVISLQEGDRKQTIWLSIPFIIIQEGLGSLPFGCSLLWFGSAVLFFKMGRYLFESQNFLFILLMGFGMGLVRYGLTRLMMSMQGYAFDSMLLAMAGCYQAFLFPLVWGLANLLRPRRIPDAIIGG